ncbi:MAG: TRAP transporter small permease [Clostridiales bacterium]|nr:TRAP transporter small permease [Clostridiales bacterium]
MKALKWLDDNLEETILILLLICMACIMGAQVVARYALNRSISWSEELTQYMFVWATFISISYCVKKRISIKIEQFINILPERGKTGLRLFRHTIVLVFCVIMLPYSWMYVRQAIDLQARSAAMGLPMYFVQSAPLVGFILLTIRVAEAWWREFKNLRRKEAKEA